MRKFMLVITVMMVISATAFSCYAETNDFEVRTYADEVTGLSLSYDIHFPENYSAEQNGKKYPAVFFIADASSVGKEPMYSVTQGLGATVWTEYDCIVIVPTFNEVIIDDHGSFTTSKYIETAHNFIIDAMMTYSIDESRVYATGQSMGCMTFLLMASKYPELFTACLFVSGQWNIEELGDIARTKFIYAASYGDDKASKGQREVLDMFISKKLTYAHYDNVDAKSMNISINPSQCNNFITFRKGTTLSEGTDNAKFSEHMTSFNYAYADKAVREWLLSQKKGD